MNESPHNEGPVGSVPKSADEEDDKSVAYRFPFAHPRTSEWDVQRVIAEPRRQRDVLPPPPKFRYVT